MAGLLRGSDGSFYGTTALSNSDSGAIFKFTQGGVLTTLYTFCLQAGCWDGKVPSALVQGSDGNFYRTILDAGRGVEGGICTGVQCGVPVSPAAV